MSIRPLDFLAAAIELSTVNTEISKRNALSRAYYAAFHTACEKFPLDKSYTPPNNDVGVHKKYISYLISRDAASVERLMGLALQKLHKKRIKADYKLDENLMPDDLALQIEGTKKIFKMVGIDLEKY